MPRVNAATAAPGGVLSPVRFRAAGLPGWSAAVRRAEVRQGRARLLCIGDSTTAGYGVGREGAWPRKLAELMAGRGGRETAFFGNAGLGATYDGRMARGAGWTADTTKGLGGGFHRNLSVTANPLIFTPQTAFDAVDVYLFGTTSVRVTIGSGTPVTATGAFGNQVGKVTVTCAQAGLSRGLHTVAIRALNDGGNTGLDCHDAAAGISVLNAGVSGWRAGDFVPANYGVADTIDVLNPDLTLYNVGINDWTYSPQPSEAAWKADVQTVISRCLAIGSEVLLISPNPVGPSFAAAEARRATYRQWLTDLASANAMPAPFDLAPVLGGSYAAANAAGYMFDELHPSVSGHARIAEALKARIA